MTVHDWIVVAALLTALAVAILLLVGAARHPRPDQNIVTAADVEEQDQVELPDHRIVDRELAQIIGAPTTAWGESERLQYRPGEFQGPLHCLSCQRAILSGQWFWDTALLSKRTRLPLGASFQTCLSCQPGDAEANRGQ